MSDAQANFAYSIVTVAPSPAISGTSLTVATGGGTLFPAVPFNCTVWPINQIPLATNAEIVRVTNIAGDVFTITRAQEGSTAQAIAIGYQIANTATVKTFTDLVPKTTTVSAGTGLSGGGDLSANRSFAVAGNLATLFVLSNATGWLHNDGSGVLAWSTPTATQIGATTVGNNIFSLTNPSAITFLRINADNTVTALDASSFRTAIGAGTGNGTVTAVSVVTANGFAGSSSGGATPALTLTTSITGVLKGNGTAILAAAAATDYVAPSAYASANGLTLATARLLGRTTAGSGAAEEISVGTGLSLAAGSLACTVTSPVGANPTASVGLTAVNGSAATFLRSDAAPALSQAITPTWTGLHIFNVGKLTLQDTTTTGSTLILASNSSTALTANRTLTLDVVNADRTIKLTGNATLNQDVSASGSPSFAGLTLTGALSAGANSITGGAISGTTLATSAVGAWTSTSSGATTPTITTTGTGSTNPSLLISAPSVTTPFTWYLGGSGANGSFFIYDGTANRLTLTSTGINSTSIGLTTPAAGSFTTLSTTGDYTIGPNTSIKLASNSDAFSLLFGNTAGTDPRITGVGSGSLNKIFYDANTHTFRASDGATARAILDSTGLAVTGALTTTGKVTNYNSVSTAGWGVVAVQAAGRSTSQIAAVSSVAAYTVGGEDGSFEVSANVNLTTAGVGTSFTVTCAYTDETNTARTLTLGFTQLSGATFLTAITTATGTGPYESPIYHIRCKASTSITIATTGTFPSSPSNCVYNVEGIIKQTA